MPSSWCCTPFDLPESMPKANREVVPGPFLSDPLAPAPRRPYGSRHERNGPRRVGSRRPDRPGAELGAEVEALERGGKRQAAPFSKGTRVNAPKRPGRKPGQGLFKRRGAAAPEWLSEPPIDVPVAES